ncbi:MAG: restriction endonuclease subunit S [Bacteroides sp.]|jgi:type I restriction enzyme S subunit|nr:restriction endonuclease subunit S [Bacteroides sp.]
MMRKYEKYKDSGVEWIGKVPEHWNNCRLKFDCSLKGRIGWKGLRSDEFKTESYAYLVTGQDFRSSDIEWSKCYQINKNRYDEDPFIQLRNGDLLITKDGTIGKIAKVSNMNKPACLNSGIFVMKQKSKNEFTQGFLYWLLCSDLFKGFNQYTTTGTTILHLYQNVFENMPLLIPSLSEQESISSYLDSKVGKIDGMIEKTEKKIELYEELKKSIITRAVTKGLNPNAKMKDSGVAWIGKIPEHWKIIKLKFLINNYKAGPFGSSLITSNLLSAGNILVYTPEHIAKQSVNIEKDLYLPEERKNEMSQFSVHPGDYIIPIVGTLGRAMLISNSMPNGIINQRIARFRIKNSKLDKKYLLLLLDRNPLYNDYFKLNCRGSIIVNITKEIVGDIPIVYPPFSEQQSIATYLDSKTNAIDSQISKARKRIGLLKELKASLITNVVTGKIKVC